MTIFTDHGNLRWLFDQAQTGRLARWVCKLQQYNITIAYIPGPKNTVADALSRYGIETTVVNHMTLRQRVPKDSNGTDSIRHQSAIHPPFQDRFIHVDWNSEQQRDTALVSLSQKQNTLFTFKEGIIFRKTLKHVKLAVPEHLIDLLINAAHSSPLANHPGVKQTIYSLKDYWFPAFRPRIESLIKACKTCLCAKPSISHKNYQTRLPALPLERLSIDIKGPLPVSPDNWETDKKYIITILDESSKFINGIPVSNCTTPTVIKAIERHWIQLFGPPKEIITDDGSQFIGKEFEEFARQYSIHLIPTAPYSQFQNPVERVHREIGNKIRAIKRSSGVSWAESLHLTILSINNSRNSNTGNSPMQLLFGQSINPVTLDRASYMDNIKELRSKANIRAYSNRQNALDKRNNKCELTYQLGDTVFISNSWRTSKLDYYFLDTPMTYIKELATNIVQLQTPEGKLIRCHIHDIRKL